LCNLYLDEKNYFLNVLVWRMKLSQSWVGRKIADRYQLEELLGAGGMSAVYRAIDPNLRRVVAVKLIHPHLSVNPNFVDRFKEEAAAVASLKHPNIVQVYDFNNEGETFYMVMEYLAGETLQARMRRLNKVGRKFTIEEAIRICQQVCDAAGYAHKHDLVHRDIKPANIMLDVNGQAILMDFGIVKIVGGQYHTATGATIGTAVYMSPEQIRSERVDGRSDIYSIGVMLFEMLSGHPPYEADSALTLMMMHLNDPIPDPQEIRDDVPPDLTSVVVKALAKDAKERYQSAEELAEDLRAVKVSPGISSKQTTISTNIKTTSAQPQEIISQEEADEDISLEVSSQIPETKLPTEIATEISPETDSPGTQPPRQEREPDAVILDDASSEESNIVDTKKLPSKIREIIPSHKWFLAISGIIIIILVGGLIWAINQRRPPSLKLMPIEHPVNPINLETQPRLVNLGHWEMDAGIAELGFTPDATFLVSANNRDWIRLPPYQHYANRLEVSPGINQLYFQDHNGFINSLAVSPDGEMLATSSEDESIRIWNINDGVLLSRYEPEQGYPSSLEFSPNGKTLAGGTWEGVALWQVSNGILLRIYKAGESGMNDVSFSPDGVLLASGDDDGNVYVWNVEDGSLIHSLQGHTSQISCLTFSPDGSQLASGSDDTKVMIWQVDDGSLVSSVTAHEGGVSSIAFSPDGNILASGGWDNTLRLWQSIDGTLLKSIEMDDSANDLVFSPDGAWLVSANGDRSIQFWGISDVLSSHNP